MLPNLVNVDTHTRSHRSKFSRLYLESLL